MLGGPLVPNVPWFPNVGQDMSRSPTRIDAPAGEDIIYLPKYRSWRGGECKGLHIYGAGRAFYVLSAASSCRLYSFSLGVNLSAIGTNQGVSLNKIIKYQFKEPKNAYSRYSTYSTYRVRVRF